MHAFEYLGQSESGKGKHTPFISVIRRTHFRATIPNVATNHLHLYHRRRHRPATATAASLPSIAHYAAPSSYATVR